jgi:DNA-binding transcriptional MerR regulator
MPFSLAIGDFSRATHVNIKTLRHYHRIGLLEPAQVDPGTGHRRYGTDQIPTAQVIRRFRALDMPLGEIHAVITTPDLAATTSSPVTSAASRQPWKRLRLRPHHCAISSIPHSTPRR